MESKVPLFGTCIPFVGTPVPEIGMGIEIAFRFLDHMFHGLERIFRVNGASQVMHSVLSAAWALHRLHCLMPANRVPIGELHHAAESF